MKTFEEKRAEFRKLLKEFYDATGSPDEQREVGIKLAEARVELVEAWQKEQKDA